MGCRRVRDPNLDGMPVAAVHQATPTVSAELTLPHCRRHELPAAVTSSAVGVREVGGTLGRGLDEELPPPNPTASRALGFGQVRSPISLRELQI
jgi:hypothetical protein